MNGNIRLLTISAVLGYIVLYIAPLGVRPLAIADEFRYAEIPREMLHSGDWVVPRLNGLRYFEKPILGYWAIAASMLAFGENAFAARLPSALSVGISALLLYLLAVKSGRGRPAAVLAAAGYLTCAQVLVLGTFNILDSMFSCLLTATLACLYLAYIEVNSKRRSALLAGCGACCGGAFLVKGFLALAIPAIILVPFLIWEWKWRDLARSAWIPLVVFLVVALPWSLAIAVRAPDFWRYFFWEEHVERFRHGKHGEHVQGPWYYPMLLLLGAFPWDLFLVATIAGWRRIGLREPFQRFVACWAFFPLLLLMASEGKLGTYLLPYYVPLAILMLLGLIAYLESGGSKIFSAATAAAATVAGLAGAAVIVNETHDPWGLRLFDSTDRLRWALASGALLAMMGLFIRSLKIADPVRRVAIIAAAAVWPMFTAPFLFPNRLTEPSMPEAVLRQNETQVPSAALLISDDELVHAVCWTYRRNDVILLLNPGELRYGLSFPDAGDRLRNVDGLKQLIATARAAGRKVVVVLSTSTYRDHIRPLRQVGDSAWFPKPVWESSEQGVWMGAF